MWDFYRGSKRFDKGRGKTFRHIHTTQERRENCERLRGEQFLVASYRRRDLPEYRDEIMRHLDRSWKSHRKTQYRTRDVNDGILSSEGWVDCQQ